MSYDAIVLAAGKNTRLRGIVPSYHKPLVIVNGKPLIVHIVQNLLELGSHLRRIVLIVSPENASAIMEVLSEHVALDENVIFMLQPVALGPGDAIIRGMQAVTADRTIIALGDNITSYRDLSHAVTEDLSSSADVTVSVAETRDASVAEKFTRIAIYSPSQYDFVEGREGGADYDGVYRYWVGPLLFSTVLGRRALLKFRDERRDLGQELKVSGAFNGIPNLRVTRVLGGSLDIGTSESLLGDHQRACT